MTGEGDNPDVDTEECLKPHNFKQLNLGDNSGYGGGGVEKEIKVLFPRRKDADGESGGDGESATTVRKFRDMGESDEDLQEVKKLITDKRHNIILVIRLESSSSYRNRYLMIISSQTKFKRKSKSSSSGQDRFLNDESQMGHKQSASHNQSSQAARKEDDILGALIESGAQLRRHNNKHASVPNSISSGNVSKEDSDFCLLGVDAVHNREENGEIGELNTVTIGFVLNMLWDTRVSLDGDGGFSVLHLDKHFVFKPVSVQALWTVIQTLHLITGKLKPKRHSVCLGDSDWTSVYLARISSIQSCINEWNTMPDVTVRRAPSPDELTRLNSDQLDQETKKCLIKSKLREIMKEVDLDTITSKKIRTSLEVQMGQPLNQHKAFIDEEILVILGQMDPASRIFDFLYLGSEWNASNLEELNSNGVTHILNVTKEIDNFFPSIFKYLNIREYDVEETDLMKYWDQTYNFIKECLSIGGKVLVHCKMGISRSASTVIAFAMKYYQWSMVDTLKHVVSCRSIADPNPGFRHQLCVYEGILEASKKSVTFRKHRSKSESSADRQLPNNCSNADTKRVAPNRTYSCRINRDSSKMDKIFLPHAFLHQNKEKSADNEKLVSNVNKESADSVQIGEGDLDNKTISYKIKDTEPNCDNQTPILPDWSRRPKWRIGEKSSSQPVDDREYREQDDPIVCHCYSDLALYISSKHVRSSAIEEPRAHGNSTNNLVEATNLQVRLNPDCPARTHIEQCTCNLELELKVPESPVEVSVSPPSYETDLILRNLGNFPIDIRQRGYLNQKDDWLETEKYEDENIDCHLQNQNNDLLLLKTPGEELSVKTLADMYEFKLGENPSKPPLPSKHTRIVESKIGEIAKKLSMAEVSEC